MKPRQKERRDEMAAEKKAAGTQKKETEKVVVSTEPKFSLEQLRKHCVRLFNITSSTFDGAFYGRTGEYTVKEAQGVINEWLRKEAR